MATPRGPFERPPLDGRALAAREISATIKLVLSVMEELAGLEPVVACEPYFFEQQRARVMRRLHIMAETCKVAYATPPGDD
jgi:hypothetical protein